MSFVSEPELGFVRVDDAEEIVLREYQHEAVAQLRANIKAGISAQILAIMVGAGKTVVGAYLLRECWQKGRHGMFVVDRISLLDQTSAVFDRYGIPHGVIQAGHSRYRPGELIQVASLQTLARRGWPNADLLIIDECHALYKSAIKRIETSAETRIIGLTATPFTRGLGRYYKALVNVTTGNKLTSEGFLVPFKVWAAKEPDMRGAKVVAGEWTDEAARERSLKIVGDVVAEYQGKGEERKFICFGVDVKHCEELQRQFIGAGINAALYTYLTMDEEREMTLREFRKPDSRIRGLISVAALSRGFDVPDVGAIIMCRPLKSSFAEFIQIMGRGLRPSPEKRDCYILDLAGNFMRHYPAMVEFFEEGAQELDDGKPKPPMPSVKAERKPRKCPRCKCVFGAGTFCPSCGFIMPKPLTIQHEAGSLATFDGSGILKMDREQKVILYGELKYIARKRGYKDGWIAWTYHAVVGVWPKGMKSTGEGIAPSASTLAFVEKRLHRPARINGSHLAGSLASGNGHLELDLFA